MEKTAPEWHAQVIAEIEREYAETNELTETARRRRARLGMMLIWIKAMGKADGSIPHGSFGPWMKQHLPGIPTTTAGDYITEAKSICDLLHWQISEIREFDTPPHKLLTAAPDELSTKDKAHQKKLLNLVDAQSHYRAVTQYKQVELKDDATVPKVGRAKGEGGKPGRPTDSVAAMVEFDLKASLRKMGKVDHELGKLGIGFLAQPDDVLMAWLGTLERSARCAREWLNTTPAKRDAKEIAKLWKTL